ncbi:MAG: hypothetical protein KAR20_04375 [Candidatus Heimdallarchaeota archaeon]|nr:hypothetical protein [Candidatus Heimdallarchaeota archaeon]
MGIGAIYIKDVGVNGREIGINEASWVLLIVSWGLVDILIGLSHFEIRKGGILYLYRFSKWEEIKSYECGGEYDHTITLMFEEHFPFRRKQIMFIPAHHKGTVENLLAQNLPSKKINT